MNKIDKTICFFWVGDKIEIPQSLVQSIRLTMGDKVNVVQLTNYETKEIKDVNSVKRGTLGKRVTNRVVGKVSGRLSSAISRGIMKLFS